MIPYEITDDRCGRVAAYMRRVPRPMDPISSADFVLLNGDQPQYASLCLCGSCGQPFTPLTRNIRPRAA